MTDDSKPMELDPMKIHKKLKKMKSQEIYGICHKKGLAYPTVMKLKNSPYARVNFNTLQLLTDFFNEEIS